MTIKDWRRARALFRERRIPVTQQRLAVYAALVKAKDHPSADALYAKLKPANPSLSLATVYKTLQTFQKAGLAGVVNAPHAEARYDAITGVHHHAICGRCGAIEDVFDARLDRLSPPRAVVKGFSVATHSVHFHGVCRDCLKGGRKR